MSEAGEDLRAGGKALREGCGCGIVDLQKRFGLRYLGLGEIGEGGRIAGERLRRELDGLERLRDDLFRGRL